MSCNIFQQKLLLLELGEIGVGIFYSALTDWLSDMKRQNRRDRFQKTERATCASQKCVFKKFGSITTTTIL